jgi:hypothetical protein
MSAPKRRRVVEMLRRRAEHRHGVGAEPIIAVYDWIRGGGTIATLAESLATDLHETMSLSWLKWVIGRLAPDAKQQIATLTHGMAHLLAALRAGQRQSVPPNARMGRELHR